MSRMRCAPNSGIPPVERRNAMSLQVNLRHLEDGNVRLCGELPVADLDLDVRDEMLHLREPLSFDLNVQMLDQSLLIQGRFSLKLDCGCVRCLKPFSHLIQFDPWTCHVPLEGED